MTDWEGREKGSVSQSQPVLASNGQPEAEPSAASAALTREQLEADVAFLLLRARAAGSVSFRGDRWTGMSSNALVDFAYGGAQSDMPYDRSDYAACVRTFVRLPPHRRTPDVRAALEAAREAYLGRYPEDRFPAVRRAARERQDAEWKARQKPKRRRRA